MRARTPTDIGNVIRARRNGARLSQQELAQRAGVSRPWLAQVEAGHPLAEIAVCWD